jgi:RNA polymerase sigma-70 factor (ECF subfamily)
MDSSERITIEAALRGDSEAFEMIIRTHGRLLYAHAYSILHQPQEAEDVVQESLLKAFQSRWKVRNPEKFLPWMISITRHRAVDVLRRRRTVPLEEDGPELADPLEEKPDRKLEHTEIRERIHGALSSLPDHHRVAITLRYLEGMDYPNIEKAMGLSNGALRGILGRALQVLRTELKPLMTT